MISRKYPSVAQAEIITNPKAITINATRGESLTRTITLWSIEKVSNVKMVTLDLLSADNSSVLPAGTITIASSPTQINPQELMSLPIQFNFQNARSGEFTGEIALTYEGGGKTIPVIVRLKDPWPLPLTILILGIIIGMVVSAYSNQGKLNDEVTVKLENLHIQIDSDKTEARSFWLRADMYLNVAKQARDAKQIVEAQTALNNTKEVWHKWINQRPNWLIQFHYYDQLVQRLNQDDLKNTSIFYIQAIARDLDQVLQNAPVLSTPNELQKLLDKLSQQINTYIQIKIQLEKMQNLMSGLEDSNQRYEWEDKASDLTQELYIILPSQEAEIEVLKSKIDTYIETIKGLEIQAFEIEKGIKKKALKLIQKQFSCKPHQYGRKKIHKYHF